MAATAQASAGSSVCPESATSSTSRATTSRSQSVEQGRAAEEGPAARARRGPAPRARSAADPARRPRQADGRLPARRRRSRVEAGSRRTGSTGGRATRSATAWREGPLAAGRRTARQLRQVGAHAPRPALEQRAPCRRRPSRDQRDREREQRGVDERRSRNAGGREQPVTGARSDVAGAAHGMDAARLGEALVDLGAQAADMRLDDVGLGVEVVVPDPLQQHGAGHHLAGVAHQVFEQRNSRGCSSIALPPRVTVRAQQVHLEVGDAQHRLATCSAAGGGPGPRAAPAARRRRRAWSGSRRRRPRSPSTRSSTPPSAVRNSTGVDARPRAALDQRQPVDAGQHAVDDQHVVLLAGGAEQPVAAVGGAVDDVPVLGAGPWRRSRRSRSSSSISRIFMRAVPSWRSRPRPTRPRRRRTFLATPVPLVVAASGRQHLPGAGVDAGPGRRLALDHVHPDDGRAVLQSLPGPAARAALDGADGPAEGDRRRGRRHALVLAGRLVAAPGEDRAAATRRPWPRSRPVPGARLVSLPGVALRRAAPGPLLPGLPRPGRRKGSRRTGTSDRPPSARGRPPVQRCGSGRAGSRPPPRRLGGGPSRRPQARRRRHPGRTAPRAARHPGRRGHLSRASRSSPTLPCRPPASPPPRPLARTTPLVEAGVAPGADAGGGLRVPTVPPRRVASRGRRGTWTFAARGGGDRRPLACPLRSRHPAVSPSPGRRTSVATSAPARTTDAAFGGGTPTPPHGARRPPENSLFRSGPFLLHK